MKTLHSFLKEMAAPKEQHRSLMFYHGVSDEETASKILASGHLKGPEEQGKSKLAPVKNRVYITPHLHYAQIYAIGGDIAGTEHHNIKGEHGHVFAVAGKHLQDIQPDEDDVGRAVHDETHPWLNHMARHVLTRRQHARVKDGWYADWAQSGKKLLKHMNDQQKLHLIDSGAHVAHEGKLPISAAWRIHKDKVPHLKRDGSNFFDHAERVL